MSDIDLNCFTGTSFNIIGSYYYFTGVFDGNNHTISNFSYTTTGTSRIGLFRNVSAENAEIKNLGLIEPNVNAGKSDYVGLLVGKLSGGTISGCYVEGGSVSGDARVGGLVGDNYFGTISNCSSSGSVEGTERVGGLVGYDCYGIITNCFAMYSIVGDNRVGGLLGDNYHGLITNSYSSGSITGDEYVGGLVGYNDYGLITKCGSSAIVLGGDDIGGLVGYNDYGTISNSYSFGSVLGDDTVGGLVGYVYYSAITDCYSTGNVSGEYRVGGLVGDIEDVTISDCFSEGEVSGTTYIGGLVGVNYHGTITKCYSLGNVDGDKSVGGLVACNGGTITNCYSTSSVTAGYSVGGLVGENGLSICGDPDPIPPGCRWLAGTISDCYSNGRVAGESDVGGLVGYDESGEITGSFWDVNTSGQDWSDGGIGLPTEDMQNITTFTDSGWDFVGESVIGIEDIWFIPQQDYPHLWWEGMQVPMKLTPVSLNCRSEGNWVKAHITLPEGFTVADVDPVRPVVLHSFGYQSLQPYVFVNKNKVVEIEAAFERQALCSLAGDWPENLTVAGFLADGNIFLGTSTVRIIHPGMKVIEELASCWLQGDCVYPETDINRDSLVNLLDYAFLMNTNVEFVTDE
jgi:hypothetical protein